MELLSVSAGGLCAANGSIKEYTYLPLLGIHKSSKAEIFGWLHMFLFVKGYHMSVHANKWVPGYHSHI